MARESTLTIRVASEIKDALKGFDQLSTRAQRMSRNLNRVGRTLSRNVTAPILAAGAGLFALAVRAGQAADKILDLEQQTGLSTDTIQEFRRVATEVGVAQDAVSDAALRLTRNLSTTGDESARARRAFDQLGIATEDADGNLRSMDALLPEIIEALQGVENITARNSIAVALFGRGASELLPVLGLSAERMREVREEARRMGLVLDRDALEAANAFRREFDILKQVGGIVAQQMGQELVPIFRDLVAFLQDRGIPAVQSLVEWFGDLDPKTVKTTAAVAGFVAVIGPGTVFVARFTTAIIALATASKAAAVKVGVLKGGLVALTAKITLPIALLAALGGSLAAMAGLSRRAKDETDGLAKSFDDLSPSAQRAIDAALGTSMAVEEVGEKADETSDLLAEAEEAARRVEEAFRSAAEGVRDTTDAFQSMKTPLQARIIELRDGAEAARIFTDMSRGLTAEQALELEGMRRLGDALEEVNERRERARDLNLDMVETVPVPALERLIEASRRAGDEISALDNVFAGIALSGASAFGDLAARGKLSIKSLVDESIRQLARLAAAFALFKGLSALFPGAGFVKAFGRMAGFQQGGQFRVAGTGGIDSQLVAFQATPGETVTVTRPPETRAAPQQPGGTLVVRLDTASLPPRPQTLTPEAAASDDWWRRAFSALKVDYHDRGGR